MRLAFICYGLYGLVARVACQSIGDGYKILDESELFYCAGVEVPNPTASNKPIYFVVGGWIMYKGPNSIVRVFNYPFSSSSSFVSYSSSFPVHRLTRSPPAQSSNGIAFAIPKAKWVFVGFIHSINYAAMQYLRSKKDTPQIFASAIHQSVITNILPPSVLITDTTKVNISLFSKEYDGNWNATTSFMSNDLTKRNLFYNFYATEIEIYTSVRLLMIGPYYGQLKYFSGVKQKTGFVVDIINAADESVVTSQYSNLVRRFGRKLLNFQRTKLSQIWSDIYLHSKHSEACASYQFTFKLFFEGSVSAQVGRSVNYRFEGLGAVTETITVSYTIVSATSLRVALISQGTTRASASISIGLLSPWFLSSTFQACEHLHIPSPRSLKIFIETNNYFGGTNSNVHSGLFGDIDSELVINNTNFAVQVWAANQIDDQSRSYLFEFIIHSGGAALQNIAPLNYQQTPCSHLAFIAETGETGCLSCLSTSSYWNMNGVCASFSYQPATNWPNGVNPSCIEYSGPQRCLWCAVQNNFYDDKYFLCDADSTNPCDSSSGWILGAQNTDEPTASNYQICNKQDSGLNCGFFEELYFDGVSLSCRCSIVSNCQACTSTSCDYCKAGFTLIVRGGYRDCVLTATVASSRIGPDPDLLAAVPSIWRGYPCVDSGCQDCSQDYKKCLSCNSNFLYYDIKNRYCTNCLEQNAQFWSSLESTCYFCFSSCGTCSERYSNSCKTCASNQYPTIYLYSNNTCAVCNTTDGWFLDTSTTPTTCKQCASTCLTCSGSSANQCLTCRSGTNNYLHPNNTCGPCDTGGSYFSETVLGLLRCTPCDVSCATCNGSSPTSCLSCPATNYLWPDNSCRLCGSSDTWIISSVIVKMFVESSNLCKPCSNNCDECQTSLNYCISCRASDKLFLNNTCGFCNTSNGFYVDGNFCKPCDPTCKSCTGPTSTECTICYETMTPSHYLHQNKTCGICNSQLGYYIDNLECKACDPTCKTCVSQGSQNCTSCFTGNYLYDTNSSCGNCNNTGTFTNSTNFYHHFISGTRCSLCTTDCLQCINLTACSTCRGSLLKYENNLTCSDCNEVKVWKDLPQSLCRDCHASCLRCNGSAQTECTECDTSLQLFLHENYTCATCDVQRGKYITADGKCKSCHDSCQTCTGNLETECTSCNFTFGPSNKLHTSNGTCGPCVFMSGYWIDNDICTICHPECKTCLAGSNTNCTSCKIDVVEHRYLSLDNHTCTSCAPDDSIMVPAISMYPLFHTRNESNLTHPICLRCNPNCKRCSNTPEYCIDCNPLWYLKEDLHLCSMCNEDRVYPDYLVMQCKPCHPSCLRCNGPEEKNCTKCDPLLYLHTNRSCDRCETSNSKFIQSLLGVEYCKDCHISCATCSGSSANQCKSCPTGLYLGLNGTCTACNGSEVFVQNNINCRYCSSFCKRCLERSDYCTECWPQDFMYPNSSCGPCNTPRFYQDFSAQSPKCMPCHSSCLTCLNASIDACQTCDKNQPTPFYLFQNNTCNSCPSERFYVKQATLCTPCDVTCLTCFGSTENQCLSCSFPRVLKLQSQCIIEELIISKIYFNTYTRSIEIEFSEPVFLQDLKLFSETSTANIYQPTENKVKLEELLQHDKFDEARDLLKRFEPASIRMIEVNGNLMNVSISSKKSIDNGIFLLTMKERFLIRGKTNKDSVFKKQFILFPDLNYVTSEFDNQINNIKGSMSAGVGMASSLVTVISLPQALILFKVFQTLDIYIFVDVEYPKNFEAFFTIISKTIISYIPGIYNFLTDEEGTPLPKRFSHFGYQVHIFKNLGPVLTIFTVIFALQMITFFLKRFKIRFIGKYIQSRIELPRNL